jgi:hypothetical protein
MLGYAYARVEAHLPMPGVFYAKHQAEMGPVILDLLLVAQVSEPAEWADRVVHLPL